MFLSNDSIQMSAEMDAAHLTHELEQLIEGDFQARWDATKRISAFGPIAIAGLTPLLQDEDLDWEVRWFAARALSTFEEPAALNALVDLLQQTREPELIAIAAEGLSYFGDRGVSALIDLLASPIHRLTAIQALANIRHPSVLFPLLAAAEDADAAVRKVAITALGCFREPQVNTVLINAVKDVASGVRQEAIANLGMRSYLLDELDLVAVLQPGLWDIDIEVNQATAIALGRLGTESAVSTLAQVLTSPHTPEALQIQIVRALGWTAQAAALQILMSVPPTAPIAVQLEIIEMLAQLRSPQLQAPAGEFLLDWLQQLGAEPTAHAALKQAIALALAALQNRLAIPLLISMLKDEDDQTRLYVEAALRQLTAQADKSS